MRCNSLAISILTASVGFMKAAATPVNGMQLGKRFDYYAKGPDGQQSHKYDYTKKTFGMELIKTDGKSDYLTLPYVGHYPVESVEVQVIVIRFFELDFGESQCTLEFEETDVVEVFSFSNLGERYVVKNWDKNATSVNCDIIG
jgi:hypothetical protein